jgi:hypothetical protein
VVHRRFADLESSHEFIDLDAVALCVSDALHLTVLA